MESERRPPRRRQAGPVLARRVQQGERANHVGLHEIRRPVDRAIDMALGGQMHHRVRRVGGEHLAHGGAVRHAGADQHMPVVAPPLLQRLLRGGVGHLVDIDHHMVGVAQQMTHHGGAYEAASARQQYLHPNPPLVVRLPRRRNLRICTHPSQRHPMAKARANPRRCDTEHHRMINIPLTHSHRGKEAKVRAPP